MGVAVLERGEQGVTPPRTPDVVDWRAVFVEQFLEIEVLGAGCAKLHESCPAHVEARDLAAARHDGDIEAGVHERPGDRRAAPQVADPKQMLDVEEHPPGHLPGPSRDIGAPAACGRPSRSSSKT